MRNHRAVHALRACLVAIVLAVVATGCTAGFVYARLHWVVSWYVNGLVGLDDSQERQLREIVRSTMAWHRQTQLPRYVSLLEDLDRDKDQTLSAGLLETRYQEIKLLYDDLLRHVLPDAASLLRTLTPAQITELAENLNEDNGDLREEFSGGTPAERAKRRQRNALRILQRFTGGLSDPQRAEVRGRLATMHDISEQWLERRAHWQARFLDILRAPAGTEQFESALADIALDPDQFDAAGYRQLADENRRTILEMLAAVANSLDAGQRGHMGRKYREYADTLQSVMSAE